MIKNRTGRSRISHQRGTVYVTVLGVAMIVSVIGLTSLHISRLELRQTQTLQDTAYARSVAQSSVEYAVAKIESDTSWRSNLVHGTEYSITPTGFNATMSYRLLDNDDSDLADDADEPVEIQGIGRYGDSTVTYSVTYARSVTSEEQVGPQVHASFETINFDSTVTINSSTSRGQYVLPSFPADAVSWTITEVDVMVSKNGATNSTLDFGLYFPNASQLPGSLIETIAVPETDLPTSAYTWHTFQFSNATGLDPSVGVCFTLSTSSSPAANLIYEPSGVSVTNAHLLENNGAGWSAQSNQSLYYRIHGVYTTAIGSGEFTITPGSWQTIAAP